MNPPNNKPEEKAPQGAKKYGHNLGCPRIDEYSEEDCNCFPTSLEERFREKLEELFQWEDMSQEFVDELESMFIKALKNLTAGERGFKKGYRKGKKDGVEIGRQSLLAKVEEMPNATRDECQNEKVICADDLKRIIEGEV